MTPRTDIDCVPEDMLLPEVARVIVESGHSRIPVFRDTRDNMVGMLHAKDILSCLLDPKMADQPASAIMREPFFVPETKPIRNLLQEFRASKQHIAIALDEYGGTSGLITIEDLLEEIVGDIEDEHDNTNYIAKQTADGDYILSGRLEIDKANELFNLGLPDSGEYKTISGLILHAYQSFPKLNEVVKVGKYHFKIVKKTMTKIEVVRLHVAEE